MRTFVLTVLAAAVLTAPLCAQVVKFDVPFEFAVGNTAAPSGEYTITQVAGSQILKLMGSDQNTRSFGHFVAVHGNGSGKSLQTKLVFHRYENNYFLAEVWTNGSISDLPMPRVERELKNKGASAAQIVVLASSKGDSHNQ